MKQYSFGTAKALKSRAGSLNSTHNGSTLLEIADLLGLTRERVRQIEAKALTKIRNRLQMQGITARDLI